MGTVSQSADTAADTARRREAQRACRDLTLDLVLRRGAFWDHVRERRHRLQHQAYYRRLREWEWAGGRCPARDEPHSGRHCPGCLACAPPDDTDDAPRAVPPTLFDPERIVLSPIHALRTAGPEGSDVELAVRDLYYRHEADLASVPPQVRQAFLAGCVRFDPPRDQLLEFADHALEWCAPTLPVSDRVSVPLREAAAEGLPIEWVPYLPDYRVAIEAQAEDHSDAFKDALRGELAGLGFDAETIDGAFRRAETGASGHLLRRLAERTAAGAAYSTADAFADATPCIRVDPSTSVEDVRQAHRFIRQRWFPTGAATKPKQHPLVSVQCAILHDELGWSFEQLGDRFGWTVEPLDYAATPRCEAARRCVAAGRSIIKHE